MRAETRTQSDVPECRSRQLGFPGCPFADDHRQQFLSCFAANVPALGEPSACDQRIWPHHKKRATGCATLSYADKRVISRGVPPAIDATAGPSHLRTTRGNRTLGAAILNGRRSLSKAHVKKLAGHFKVEPGLFL